MSSFSILDSYRTLMFLTMPLSLTKSSFTISVKTYIPRWQVLQILAQHWHKYGPKHWYRRLLMEIVILWNKPCKGMHQQLNL